MESVPYLEFDLNQVTPIEMVGRLRAFSHIANSAWRSQAAYISEDGKNVLFDMKHQLAEPVTIAISNLNLSKEGHDFVAQAVASVSELGSRHNVTYVVSFEEDPANYASKWYDTLVAASISSRRLVLIDIMSVAKS